MMTDMFWLQDARTALVTRNVLEAEDLSLTLQDHRLGPVVVVPNVRLLRGLLSDHAVSPTLVILAMDVATDEKWAVIAQCRAAGSRVIVINGGAMRQEPGSLAYLSRPFTSDDVEAALRSLHAIPA